jgi:probable ATP-dependent RNA helicase DDX4
MEEINNKLNSGGGMDSDKPRETYIPPDPTSDENEMFSNGISAGINFDKFDSIEVKVTENDGNPTKIKPIAKFEDAEIRSILLQNVEKAGYKRPTPIQKHAIPIIMAGRDLMGCAQTGSGKTCAFLLPILHGIMKHESSQLSCVIVAPTRELVIQIWTEALKFSHGSWVKVCRAYGGTQSSHQYNSIEKGCHVLVATPGRLSDFINRGYVNFSELKYLVLDEADRMLDMGFKEKIEEIANHSSFQKDVVQTLMFSATFPEDIQRLAWKFLKNYVFLAVGIVGGASSDVKQTVIEVEKFKKRGVLGDTLRELLKDSNRKVLVFVETKRTADFIACFMSDKKISSTSIHGDRLQREREIALNEFKSGKRKVLVATSVAARGLDIPQVTDVINYDLPKNIDDYVHRIGRTGRVGNEGSAISFYDSQTDSELRPHLARILKDAGQTVPEFLGAAGSSVFGGDSFGGVDIRGQAAGTQQGDDEDW